MPRAANAQYRRRPYLVCRRIDERDGIRANGDGHKRAVVGRKAEPVDEQLADIERAQRAGHGIAQPNDAEQFI